MKYKTYTFRDYPNKTQANLIYLTFTMCRYMFNILLVIVLDNFSKYDSYVEWCLKNNRDLNATINIKNEGMRILGMIYFC